MKETMQLSDRDIAVIGIACRYPAADGPGPSVRPATPDAPDPVLDRRQVDRAVDLSSV